MNLDGKVALVTGGAHRVGRAITLTLARAGASVVIHYGTSSEAAEKTAKEVRSLGREAWTMSADLSEPDAITALFESAVGEAGRLDILVNSAARFDRASFEDIDVEAWDRVQAVNLRAPFLCTRAALPHFRSSAASRGEAAVVVNIADLAGVHPWVGYAHHGVSKAGLIQLSRVAALELGPEVRVNAIVPGAVLPPPTVDEASEQWHRIGASLPVGHTGEPEQVGRAVVFVAENDFITGAVLPIDGGEHLLGAAHRRGKS